MGKTEEPKALNVLTTRCPICGNRTLQIKETEYYVPYLGKALLVSRYCTSCHYRKSEIVPLEPKRHQRIYVRITSEDDFKVKIVRTSTTSIEIPEHGIYIYPGIDAPFFITNVEGILQRFYDAARRIAILSQNKEERIASMLFLEKIDKLRKDPSPFTLILDDPAGLAKVIGSKKLKFILVEDVEGD